MYSSFDNGIIGTLTKTVLLIVCIAALSSQVIAQGSGRTAPAVVRADAEAQLSSSLSGTIEALPFNEGSAFSEGDLLVRLDCAIQRAEAEAAAADHKAAQAEFKVRRALRARGGTGEIQVVVAEAQAAATKARQRRAEAVVSKCEILAPFEGRVVETAVHEFEYVEPSEALLSVVSSGPLELEINAPAVWLRWLKVGSEGRVEFAEVDGRFAIYVTSIGAAIDPVSATIKVTAVFQQDTLPLLPGMAGLVVFE
ncbi:MAG: hypothetical protein CMI67_20825 [Pelagibaca sp.]|nr:hypothetical protein [Pelagibaca sp.]